MRRLVLLWVFCLRQQKELPPAKKIVKKGDDYIDEVESRFNKLIDSVSHKLENVGKEAMRLSKNGASKIEDAKLAGKDS